jgi:hypothetical protein
MNFSIPQHPKIQLESINEADKNDEAKTLTFLGTILNILKTREILDAEMV